jgi:hypothetical protein
MSSRPCLAARDTLRDMRAPLSHDAAAGRRVPPRCSQRQNVHVQYIPRTHCRSSGFQPCQVTKTQVPALDAIDGARAWWHGGGAIYLDRRAHARARVARVGLGTTSGDIFNIAGNGVLYIVCILYVPHTLYFDTYSTKCAVLSPPEHAAWNRVARCRTGLGMVRRPGTKAQRHKGTTWDSDSDTDTRIPYKYVGV